MAAGLWRGRLCRHRLHQIQLTASAASTNVEIGLSVHRARRLRRRCLGLLFRYLVLALFNEGRELHGAVVRDFDAWCRASDAHGRDGSIDFHVAGLCNLAGNESERTLGQAEQSRVRLAVRIVDELGHRHASIARQIESGAIGERNANLAIGTGRKNVAEIDRITDLRLARLIAKRGLDDHRTHVLDGHQTCGSNHLADRLYRSVLDGRLSLNILCLCRGGESTNRQKGTRYEDGNWMRAHRPTLWAGVLGYK